MQMFQTVVNNKFVGDYVIMCWSYTVVRGFMYFNNVTKVTNLFVKYSAHKVNMIT